MNLSIPLFLHYLFHPFYSLYIITNDDGTIFVLFLNFYTFWWVSSCRISVFICPSLITNETDYLFILCRYLGRLFCELPILAFRSFSYCILPFSFEIFEVIWIFWIKVLYQIHTNIVYQSVAFIFILLVVFLMKKSL